MSGFWHLLFCIYGSARFGDTRELAELWIELAGEIAIVNASTTGGWYRWLRRVASHHLKAFYPRTSVG